MFAFPLPDSFFAEQFRTSGDVDAFFFANPPARCDYQRCCTNPSSSSLTSRCGPAARFGGPQSAKGKQGCRGGTCASASGKCQPPSAPKPANLSSDAGRLRVTRSPGDGATITIQLPGFDRKEINVEVHPQQTLRVSASTGPSSLLYPTGAVFEQDFRLGSNIDIDNGISAAHRNGVLTITLKYKAPQAPEGPRRILIEAEDDAQQKQNVVAADEHDVPALEPTTAPSTDDGDGDRDGGNDDGDDEDNKKSKHGSDDDDDGSIVEVEY